MKFLKIFLILTSIYLFSCGTDETQPEAAEFIGRWKYVSLNVKINSADGTNKDEFFYALKGDWQQKIGNTPLEIHIKEDGSFESTFYTLPDSNLIESFGAWEVKGDSLIFTEQLSRSAYQYTLKDSLLTFRGKTDFDQDGKIDDDYVGVQERIQ